MSALIYLESNVSNSWEVGQLMAKKMMSSLVVDFQQNRPLVSNPKFIHGLRNILGESHLGKEFNAKTIILPSEEEIMNLMEVTDSNVVCVVQSFIRKKLTSKLE